MLPFVHRPVGAVVLLAMACALGGCAAHGARPSAAPDVRATTLAGYAAADMLNRTVERQHALAHIEDDAACPPRARARSRLAALREARALVKRAETAPAQEQPALEHRARELLEQLDGF